MRNPPTIASWLRCKGEMADRIRAQDWSDSPLGPSETWPQSLRSTLSVCLASKQPMYVWWGPEFINLYNDAYVPVAGAIKHPRALGRPAREMWPEIWPTLQGFIDEVRRTGEGVWREELPLMVERAGVPEQAWFTFSFNPAFDEAGAIAGFFCICAETTDKVLAERRLQEAHAQTESARLDLQRFFSQSPVPHVILSGPEHRFVLANPPYERLVGRQVVGKTMSEAFSPVESRDFVPLLDAVYRTGTPYLGKELALDIPNAQGVIERLFVNIGYHAYRDEAGAIQGILANVQDVTEQVQTRRRIEVAARELALERHRFEAIFEVSPAAMALWRGPDLVFEKVNPEYQAIYGTRPLIGLPLLEAISELADQSFPALLLQVLETGEPFVGKELLARIGQSEGGPLEDRYFDFSYLRVNDADGQPYGVYDHAIDVTARVLARRELDESRTALEQAVRELEDQHQLREQLIAAVGHDLRTPITAARMSAEVLARGTPDPLRTHRVLARIVDNMDRADQMIRDLLDASRIKGGEKISIEREACDLNEIARGVIEDLTTLHGDRFVLSAAESISGWWDGTALRRILENLAGNAIKYGSRTAPVEIGLRRERGAIELSVHNEGALISPEEQARIFEPFRRSSAASQGFVRGWGIGLTLVRGFAEAHGGTTRVSSAPGEGTTFSVRLPLDARPVGPTPIRSTLSAHQA